jgi:chromosome segregation ATPase
MAPEAITAIVTGLVALIGSIAALITSKINAGNSATKVELEDLRRRVDELKNELQTERDSNDKLRVQITAAEDAVVAAAAEKRDLRLQLDTMKEEIYSRDKQIKQDQNTMKDQDAKIKEQDIKIKEQDAKIKALENRVNEMEVLLKKYNICSGGCADATD